MYYANGTVNNSDQSTHTLVIPSLTTYAQPAESTTTSSLFNRNLTIGSVGNDVKQLQALLVREVNYSANLITGYFGPVTFEAVKRLQEKYNVSPASGYFGEITRNALTASVSNW
jgi:peptidoglycan hydrolase-like protein with peptidoglycan-binding domain